MMTQFRPEQQFMESLEDPSAAAMLVTLGFPLLKSGHEVRLADLGSRSGHQGGARRAWTLGRSSERCGDVRPVLTVWQRPLPELAQATILHGAEVCKLALHNRRVLMLQVQQGMPLHAGSCGRFGRLGNWAFAGAHLVEESAGVLNVFDTLTAAVAATCGLQLAAHGTRDGRRGWLVLPGPQNCAYSVEQVLAAVRDDAYIEANHDTLAVAAAVLRNRQALLAAGPAAGALNVLHRNGRYAVISTAADHATQLAAARHLNI